MKSNAINKKWKLKKNKLYILVFQQRILISRDEYIDLLHSPSYLLILYI